MYIGEKEIKVIEGEKITFTDDTTTEMSQKYIDFLKSEDKVEYRDYLNKKIAQVVSDIKQVFYDAGITNTQVRYVIDHIPLSIATVEKNILCSLTNSQLYSDIPLRELEKVAKNIDTSNMLNDFIN